MSRVGTWWSFDIKNDVGETVYTIEDIYISAEASYSRENGVELTTPYQAAFEVRKDGKKLLLPPPSWLKQKILEAAEKDTRLEEALADAAFQDWQDSRDIEDPHED